MDKLLVWRLGSSPVQRSDERHEYYLFFYLMVNWCNFLNTNSHTRSLSF